MDDAQKLKPQKLVSPMRLYRISSFKLLNPYHRGIKHLIIRRWSSSSISYWKLLRNHHHCFLTGCCCNCGCISKLKQSQKKKRRKINFNFCQTKNVFFLVWVKGSAVGREEQRAGEDEESGLCMTSRSLSIPFPDVINTDQKCFGPKWL